MDLKAASTIQLCLADKVMYNVMDEETATGLWSKLDTYMTKSLSNKLYLKKQLYRLRMNEATTVLEHLNFFNKVINEFLTIDIKIDEDKALTLLNSLLESYDHIVTIMLYGKELSSWRRTRQLSYLIRLKKGQIKRSR